MPKCLGALRVPLMFGHPLNVIKCALILASLTLWIWTEESFIPDLDPGSRPRKNQTPNLAPLGENRTLHVELKQKPE